MAGLTITLQNGESAVVAIPLDDENGRPINESVIVTCVRAQNGRVSLAIEAPRDFPITHGKGGRDAQS